MSELNLMLVTGHIYCPECLSQIPATFLACPVCAGFVREKGHWAAPPPPPEPARAEAMGRSLYTIRHQHESAMRKLGAHNSVELTLLAVLKGLVKV